MVDCKENYKFDVGVKDRVFHCSKQKIIHSRSKDIIFVATASYQRQSHVCCLNERVSVGKVLSEWVLVCFRVLQKMITHLTIISGWFTIIIDKKHSLIIIVPLRIKKLWGFQASPSKLLLYYYCYHHYYC